MERAIFPVPVFILPEGVTRLRIFEPRYLVMVKQSLRENSGFVLCVYEHNSLHNVSLTGYLVNIIDFDQDSNGQLLVDIQAQTAVKIKNVYQNNQTLRLAETAVINSPSWYHYKKVTEKNKLLSTELKKLFSSNPELAQLYKQTQFDNLAWVAARWLEVMPISIEKKQQLAFKSSFENLLNFLHTLVNNEFTN